MAQNEQLLRADVRLFLDGAVKIVHTAPWPHYPNKNAIKTLLSHYLYVSVICIVSC